MVALGVGLGFYPGAQCSSSPAWTPLDLSPLLWVRADLGVTLVDDRVAAWADQSGNGHDLVQTTAPLRPALVAASRGDVGFAAIDTAGGTYLETTITLPRELAIVAVTGTVRSTGYLLSHTIGSTEDLYFYSGGAATFYLREPPSYFCTTVSQPAIVSNTNHVAQYDGAQITLGRNGVDVPMGAPVGTPINNVDVAGTLRVGTSGTGAGGASLELIEVVICPPLTAPQLAELAAYFAALGRPN